MALAYAVDEDFPFVGADFHPVSSNCFLQSFSFSKLLEFVFPASQQIDGVSKPQVAKRRSPINTDDSGSGVSVYSAFCAASSAKQSFSS